MEDSRSRRARAEERRAQLPVIGILSALFALVAIVWYYVSPQSSGLSAVTELAGSLVSTTVPRLSPDSVPNRDVCATLMALRQTAPPGSPELSPMPLEVLGLTAEDLAARGRVNGLMAVVRQAVNDAVPAAAARAGPGNTNSIKAFTRHRKAIYMVGRMLSEEESCMVFLTRVQPVLERATRESKAQLDGLGPGRVLQHGPRSRAVEEMCQAIWVDMAWV